MSSVDVTSSSDDSISQNSFEPQPEKKYKVSPAKLKLINGTSSSGDGKDEEEVTSEEEEMEQDDDGDTNEAQSKNRDSEMEDDECEVVDVSKENRKGNKDKDKDGNDLKSDAHLPESPESDEEEAGEDDSRDADAEGSPSEDSNQHRSSNLVNEDSNQLGSSKLVSLDAKQLDSKSGEVAEHSNRSDSNKGVVIEEPSEDGKVGVRDDNEKSSENKNIVVIQPSEKKSETENHQSDADNPVKEVDTVKGKVISVFENQKGDSEQPTGPPLLTPRFASAITSLLPVRQSFQNAVPLLPEDGGILLEAPSLVAPYIVEREAEENLGKRVRELAEEVKKENVAKNGAENVPKEIAVPDKPKGTVAHNLSERWNAYFEGPVGKFLSEIGMNQVSEWIHHDLARKRNSGDNSKVLASLEAIRAKNRPFRFKNRKCRFCNFRTESLLVLQYHLQEPHCMNGYFRCNMCRYDSKSMYDVMNHMQQEHKVRGRSVPPILAHQCQLCLFEDTSKAKLARHILRCQKNHLPARNQAPAPEFDPPAKRIRIHVVPTPKLNIQPNLTSVRVNSQLPLIPGARYPSLQSALSSVTNQNTAVNLGRFRSPTVIFGGTSQVPVLLNQLGQNLYTGNVRGVQPSPVIAGGPTPVTLIQSGVGDRPFVLRTANNQPVRMTSTKNFVVCEICDGYVRDMEALKNHLQFIHKIRLHPRMIHSRPPLSCQKCQRRYFTDQGLERHLLGAHGLVTPTMQESASRGRDNGRCPNCNKVFQWKLLAHMSKDHGITLKPAHLSYKCTVCATTFAMYRLFEEHVYTVHSNMAKKAEVQERKKTSAVIPAVESDSAAAVSSPATTANGIEGSKTCDECGVTLPSLVTLLKHWEVAHLKPCQVKTCKVDTCTDCQKKYNFTEFSIRGESLDQLSDVDETNNNRKPCPRSKRKWSGSDQETEVGVENNMI